MLEHYPERIKKCNAEECLTKSLNQMCDSYTSSKCIELFLVVIDCRTIDETHSGMLIGEDKGPTRHNDVGDMATGGKNTKEHRYLEFQVSPLADNIIR